MSSGRSAVITADDGLASVQIPESFRKPTGILSIVTADMGSASSSHSWHDHQEQEENPCRIDTSDVLTIVLVSVVSTAAEN
jgi:hypothetical protein